MKTNVERVADFMEFSHVGAMAQLFVIEALNRYAAQLLKDEKETLRQCKDSFVSGEALIATAKEWQASENKPKPICRCPECNSEDTVKELGRVRCQECGNEFMA